MSFQIGARMVGASHPPFIIAELSGNHNQSLDRALQLVQAAADCGAHAVKLQTYTPDTMTLNMTGGSFDISDSKSLWSGENLYSLYSKAYTPWEWHKPIFDLAHQLGLVCFSSPFDDTAVDFLLDLDVPAFKIASFENNHLPLIAKVAATGKPLIISTGMASLGDLDAAVSTARTAGCQQLVLLKCTSTYPATPENSNIRTIPHLQRLFNCEVGLSDHTLGVGASVASIALGASVIEKHFTLSRSDGGVDSAFSLEPSELSSLVNETLSAWQSLGEVTYGPSNVEAQSLKFRRSIYASDDINPGDIFNTDNLRIIRPGDGLPPSFYSDLLGKTCPKPIKRGTPLSLDMLI